MRRFIEWLEGLNQKDTNNLIGVKSWYKHFWAVVRLSFLPFAVPEGVRSARRRSWRASLMRPVMPKGDAHYCVICLV